jgi:voltage-gated potassium channel
VRFNRPLWRYLVSMWDVLRIPELRPALTLVVSIMSIGTVFYHLVEGWGWVDSLYFCTVTLATVGFGDLAPQTTLGKLFTVLYILIGIGIVAAFVNAVVAHSARRFGQALPPACTHQGPSRRRHHRPRTRPRTTHEGTAQERRTFSPFQPVAALLVLVQLAGQHLPAVGRP